MNVILFMAIFQSDNEEEEKKFLRQKLFKVNPHRYPRNTESFFFGGEIMIASHYEKLDN